MELKTAADLPAYVEARVPTWGVSLRNYHHLVLRMDPDGFAPMLGLAGELGAEAALLERLGPDLPDGVGRQYVGLIREAYQAYRHWSAANPNDAWALSAAVVRPLTAITRLLDEAVPA